MFVDRGVPVPTLSPTLSARNHIVDTGESGSQVDGTAAGAAIGTIVALILLALFVRRRSTKREDVVLSHELREEWDRPIQSFTVSVMNDRPDLTMEYDERWNRPTNEFTVLPKGEAL